MRLFLAQPIPGYATLIFMVEVINVCICVPVQNDHRTEGERAEALARFHSLDSRLRFHFVEYVESPAMRAIRASGDHKQAAEKAPSISPELRAALAWAEIILAVDLPSDMHLLAPGLRWVQSVGGGVGQLQSCGLDRLDARLSSGAGLLADPIAEFVLARILSHWKLFPFLDRMQHEHIWKPAFGRSLAGSSLGIVGYGAIGQAVAWRAKAWGMRVLATRRSWSEGQSDAAVDTFYPLSQLDDLLANSDAVVLSASETPENHRMFNTTRFMAMKPGSYFCNVSRGALVDEDALRHALDTGHLAGASIDVAVEEPLSPTSPLWSTRNLAISAHCSPSMERFNHAVWDLFFDNMTRYLNNRPLRNERSNRLQPVIADC